MLFLLYIRCEVISEDETNVRCLEDSNLGVGSSSIKYDDEGQWFVIVSVPPVPTSGRDLGNYSRYRDLRRVEQSSMCSEQLSAEYSRNLNAVS